ncbi:MAG: twin-arginine translocase TatA/TatE family subunit [Phycisphaerales bacterium JB043]
MISGIDMTGVLAIGMPGPLEWTIIAILGLLIFGKRLPEVGRSIGQGIVEFKKGLKGVQDEIEDASEPKRESLADSKKTPELSEPVQSGASEETPVKQADPAG